MPPPSKINERIFYMPLNYKIDVLQALRDKGYTSAKLRKDKLLAEGVIQSLRDAKPISWANISRLCALLNCQPGDIMEYVDECITDCGGIKSEDTSND